MLDGGNGHVAESTIDSVRTLSSLSIMEKHETAFWFFSKAKMGLGVNFQTCTLQAFPAFQKQSRRNDSEDMKV